MSAWDRSGWCGVHARLDTDAQPCRACQQAELVARLTAERRQVAATGPPLTLQQCMMLQENFDVIVAQLRREQSDE